jgi:two-component system phosphate regulon response regulator PhoB
MPRLRRHRFSGRQHRNGAPRSSAPQAERKTVLIFEDYASIGGLIAGLVRQIGYRSLRAWDAEETIRLSQSRHPDLIVLDFNAPRDTLPDMVKRLREHEATREIPIVVIASGISALPDDTRELVSEVVSKPFDIDVMLNAIRGPLGDPLVEIEPRQYDATDNFLHGF